MEEIVKGEETFAAPEEKELASAAPVEEVAVETTDQAVETPAPAEETPAEETPAEDVPAEETPAVETPAVDAEAPVADASVKTAPAEDAPAEDAPAKQPQPQTCAEVIECLRALENTAADVPRDVLEQLKQIFYRLHNASMNAAREAFVAAGNDAEAFVPADRCPELLAEEADYKSVMGVIREKRAQAQKELNAKREENYLRKCAILDRLKTMIDNADTDPVSYDAFQAIQQEWRDIKDVPPEKASELWKTYQSYTERFYDLHKLNNMFREYDFKKNLEVKVRLCEEAEALADEPDVVAATIRLQQLHQEYREAGPVAREVREEVWERFKAASTVVNKRHQEYYETIRQTENENQEQKIAICELLEAIDYEALTSYNKWNEKSEEVLALQAKWKTIGRASAKQNQKLFERYRAACDVFFSRKEAFYKSTKENLTANLEKKIALCEQAEALKDSTDWKATASKLTALQKEWKTIGAVPKKQSDAVWKRFVTACDAFFANRNAAGSSQRSEEQQNLSVKKGIIKALGELSDKLEEGAEELSNDLGDRLHELVAQWNATGHVPYRDKEKIYTQYRTLVDGLFDRLHADESSRRVSNFRKTVRESGNNLDREREKLVQAYERIKNEIKTYENNLGFLKTGSKSGNSLVAEIQRKMEKLKADAEEMLAKIKAFDTPDEPQD